MKTVKGYKAVNKNLEATRGDKPFKYEIGKEYVEDEAKLCSKGFHFCENPLDTLNYYDLCDSRFFEIEARDVSDEKNDKDTKRVSKRIKLVTEIGLPKLIKLSFDYIKEQCEVKDENVINDSGYYSQVATSGDSSQVATSGDYSQVATSGDYSKVATSGYSSKVATSGDYSKVATSGYSSQVATSGDYSQVATSGDSSKVATSGDSSKVATSGDSSKVATSGTCSKVAIDGEYSVGMCAGYDSKIKGKKGNWITLAEWEYNSKINKCIPVCVKSAQIDGEMLKEDTWYILENGEFKEC